MQRRELPEGWDKDLPTFPADAKGVASARRRRARCSTRSRRTSRGCIGGSADLAPSTKTRLTFDGAGDFAADDYGGRNFHFGIREHAMGAVAERHGAVARCGRYGAGFLIFSDYGRAADPAGGDHGDPGRSTSSRTTRSASARTARRTSRSSSSPSLRAIPGLIAHPARRRQRGRRGVAGRSCSCEHEPGRAGPDAAGAADARPHEVRAGRGPGEGRLRAGRRRRTASRTCILIGTGSEVSLCVEALRAADGARASRRASSACRRGSCSSSQPQAYRDSVLPPERDGARRRSSRRRRSAGSATSGATGAMHRHARPSAPRRRSRTCRRSSASPSRTWSPRRRSSSAGRSAVGRREPRRSGPPSTTAKKAAECAMQGCGDRCSAGDRGRTRCARREREQEADVQLGMIGLGRMGVNIVQRLLRAGHDLRRVRPEREGGRGPGEGRCDGAAIARRVRAEAREAARDLGDGAGRRVTDSVIEDLGALPGRTATSSSTAATPTSRTTCAAPRELLPQGHPLRRLSAPAAASGASSAATA